MRVLSAEINNFRNISCTKMGFDPGFTWLLGPNGQGKTNTLEALYLIGALRPLRSVPRQALIQTGQTRATISVQVHREDTGLEHMLEIELDGTTRKLRKDGKSAAQKSFLGHLVTVAFTPDHLQLVKGGPDQRRRFLDRAILNLRPVYLDTVNRYGRAIRERNRVLVEGGADTLLDAYDALVAKTGAPILLAREAYIREVASRIEARFQSIAAPAPVLSVRYRPGLPEWDSAVNVDVLEAEFYRILVASRAKDRRRRTTSIGPHLDDMDFTIDTFPAKEWASQGQQRAIVLAVKLIELLHLTERLREPPLLLLDDMSSELDPIRTEQLYQCVRDISGQVVLTSTASAKAMSLGWRHGGKAYRVSGGALTEDPIPPNEDRT
jgi:DNA replication and repair protein RecF